MAPEKIHLNINEHSYSAEDKYKYINECIEKCLQSLPTESREAILLYYDYEKRDKIERRKRLADRLGVPLGTLRMRAHRLRAKVEECVLECVNRLAGRV